MSGRVALVTGGSRGIGKAIARALADAGMTVYVNYSSDEAAAEEAVREIAAAGGVARPVRADVSVQEQVRPMLDRILSETDRLDVLVNNAGIIRDGLLMLMPDDNWRRVIDVNLNSVYYCSKAVLRPMIGNRWGRIINIISPSAILGRPGQTNYSASKGGILSFTRSLAREVAKLGITVNTVSPGVIATDLTHDMEEKLRKEFLGMIPLGRFGTPEETARAVLYLASDEAGYITGQNISVDGGLT